MPLVSILIPMNTKLYTVCLWGSNPDLENDDCWVGIDFATRAEALAAFDNPRQMFAAHPVFARSAVPTEGEYLEVDGPDIHGSRPLRKGEWVRSRRQTRLDDAAARSEAVWQHRMAFGITDEC